MKMTRRDFVKAVASAVLVPVAGGTGPATTWAVNRRNMWSPDCTSDGTLNRCNRLLVSNPDDVLALIHRGQVPSVYTDAKQAWADLSRAIELEFANPCCWYIRGVCFHVAADLKYAILLLSKSGDIDGKATCTSVPDLYHFHGTDDGELLYLSYRELGSVLEGQGRIEEALAAFERAASFRVIAQADLQRWCEADMQAGRLCEAVIGYRMLIGIENKAEYRHRLQEAERWMRMPRQEWRESRP